MPETVIQGQDPLAQIPQEWRAKVKALWEKSGGEDFVDLASYAANWLSNYKNADNPGSPNINSKGEIIDREKSFVGNTELSKRTWMYLKDQGMLGKDESYEDWLQGINNQPELKMRTHSYLSQRGMLSDGEDFNAWNKGLFGVEEDEEVNVDDMPSMTNYQDFLNKRNIQEGEELQRQLDNEKNRQDAITFDQKLISYQDQINKLRNNPPTIQEGFHKGEVDVDEYNRLKKELQANVPSTLQVKESDILTELLNEKSKLSDDLRVFLEDVEGLEAHDKDMDLFNIVDMDALNNTMDAVDRLNFHRARELTGMSQEEYDRLWNGGNESRLKLIKKLSDGINNLDEKDFLELDSSRDIIAQREAILEKYNNPATRNEVTAEELNMATEADPNALAYVERFAPNLEDIGDSDQSLEEAYQKTVSQATLNDPRFNAISTRVGNELGPTALEKMKELGAKYIDPNNPQQYQIEFVQQEFEKWYNDEYTKRLTEDQEATQIFKEYGVTGNKYYEKLSRDYARLKNPNLKWVEELSKPYDAGDRSWKARFNKTYADAREMYWKHVWEPGEGDEEGQLGAGLTEMVNSIEIAAQKEEYERRSGIVDELDKAFELEILKPNMSIGESLDAIDQALEDGVINNQGIYDWNELKNRFDDRFGAWIFKPESFDRVSWGEDDNIKDYYERKKLRLGNTTENLEEDVNEYVDALKRKQKFNELDLIDPLTGEVAKFNVFDAITSLAPGGETPFEHLTIDGLLGRLGQSVEQIQNFLPQAISTTAYSIGTIATLFPEGFISKGTAATMFAVGNAFAAAGGLIEGAQTYGSLYMEGVQKQMDKEYGEGGYTAMEYLEALKDDRYGDQLAAILPAAGVAGISFASDYLLGKAGKELAEGMLGNSTVQSMMKNTFLKWVAGVAPKVASAGVNPYKEGLEELFQNYLEQVGGNFVKVPGEQIDSPFRKNIDFDELMTNYEMGYQMGELFGAGSVVSMSATQAAQTSPDSYATQAMNRAINLDMHPESSAFQVNDNYFKQILDKIKNDKSLLKKDKTTQIKEISAIRKAALKIPSEIKGANKAELIRLLVAQEKLENIIKRTDNKELSVNEIMLKAEIDEKIKMMMQERVDDTIAQSILPFIDKGLSREDAAFLQKYYRDDDGGDDGGSAGAAPALARDPGIQDDGLTPVKKGPTIQDIKPKSLKPGNYFIPGGEPGFWNASELDLLNQANNLEVIQLANTGEKILQDIGLKDLSIITEDTKWEDFQQQIGDLDLDLEADFGMGVEANPTLIRRSFEAIKREKQIEAKNAKSTPETADLDLVEIDEAAILDEAAIADEGGTNELLLKTINDPNASPSAKNAAINTLINSNKALYMKAVGFDPEAGSIQAKAVWDAVRSALAPVIKNYKEGEGATWSTYSTKSLMMKRPTIYSEAAIGQGTDLRIDDPNVKKEIENVVEESSQEKEVGPKQREKITVSNNPIIQEYVSPDAINQIKEDTRSTISNLVNKGKSVNEIVKALETEVEKSTWADIKKSLGMPFRWLTSKIYSNFINKLFDSGFVKNISVHDMKNRFKVGKNTLFGIKETGKVPTTSISPKTGKKGIYNKQVFKITIPGVKTLKNYFLNGKTDTYRARAKSLFRLIAKDITIESLQELKADDTKGGFMEKLTSMLKEQNHPMNAQEFMDAIDNKLDRRNLEDASFDKVESKAAASGSPDPIGPVDRKAVKRNEKRKKQLKEIKEVKPKKDIYKSFAERTWAENLQKSKDNINTQFGAGTVETIKPNTKWETFKKRQIERGIDWDGQIRANDETRMQKDFEDVKRDLQKKQKEAKAREFRKIAPRDKFGNIDTDKIAETKAKEKAAKEAKAKEKKNELNLIIKSTKETVKTITGSELGNVKIQKEGRRLTKFKQYKDKTEKSGFRDVEVANDWSVRDLDSKVPGNFTAEDITTAEAKTWIESNPEKTIKEAKEAIANERNNETFEQARDRVVNKFLEKNPQWRKAIRDTSSYGIDRSFFQTAGVFDKAIAKTKEGVKQIISFFKKAYVTKASKKIIESSLDDINTKAFKDRQIQGIDDLIDLYKDMSEFIQDNPNDAWVFGEIIADSTDAPMGIFRLSAVFGFYPASENGKVNLIDPIVAEHTKPNMAQQRPLSKAMMEGPDAVEALRPIAKASYMQGAFLKFDDDLVNENYKETMPEVYYTDVLPALLRGDLDYLVKKYPGILSWIRPAVSNANPNFYKSTFDNKLIAEIFGVGVKGDLRWYPDVIAAQNKAIIRILSGENQAKVIKDFKAELKVAKKIDIQALKTQKIVHPLLERRCGSPCRVPKTGKQIKEILENSLDTQVNAQKVNKKKKGISVFDLDDTLAKTKEKVIVYLPYYAPGSMTEATMELTPAEFAERAQELEDMGASFDFSQFEDVKGAQKGPLADLALRRQDKFGSGDIYVLTARPQTSAQGIKTFLDGIGLNIPIENITGLEDGTSQAKANWVLQKTKEGYNDFYFADDSKMNVDAVKQILDQVDVKSKVQQAIADKSINLDKEFNEMLEESQGMKSDAKYSKTRAQLLGKKKDKGFFKWLGKQLTITPSAEDFMGLMYDLMGSGKQGNRHAQWIRDNLIKPYNKAEQQILSAKVAVANDFAALKDTFPSLKSTIKGNPLMDQIGVGPYTKSQAMRVYMWTKQGMEIPGLSKRDQNALVKAVENDSELMAFSDNVMLINKGAQYPAPTKNWVSGTIDSDIMTNIDKDFRRKVMTEFDENVKIIFSEKNMHKLEAIYGKKWVDALKDSLRRMKSGSNRPVYQGGGARIVNEMLDWLNGSVGAVMFLNVKSGLLQLISNINFINWGDNNIYAAAKAFASKEYWPTVMKLLNSDYLVNRRDGLKINVNEAELANAARDGGMKGAINYLLDKGFIITRIMDSLAIATGGATFYINRRNALLKRQNPETGKKYTQAEAEAKAFDDFYAISEETQQSSNPSKISQQQASLFGRVLLAFQNVTMQYNRKTKKSIRDLYNRRKKPGMTQRESDLSNISSIIYYTTVQNLIFNALQQALFALAFDDEPEKEEKKKLADVANGMLDSLLFGLGFGGAAISTVKNVLLKVMEEHDKKSPDYEEAVWEIFNVSPVLDSKIRKLRTTAKTFSWNMEEIKKRGWSLDNPTYLAVSQLISAATNIPIDRVMRKMMNMRQAMDEETRTWQRVALILGWNGWSLGLPYWGLQSTIQMEEEQKEKLKATYKKDIQRLKAQGYKKVMYRNLEGIDPDDIIELQSPAGTVVYYVKTKKKK